MEEVNHLSVCPWENRFKKTSAYEMRLVSLPVLLPFMHFCCSTKTVCNGVVLGENGYWVAHA